MFAAGALAIVGFLASGFAAFAPWFVNLYWSSGGASQTPLSVAFLFFGNNTSSDSPTSVSIQFNWCGSVIASSATCTEMANELLGFHIAFALGAVMSVAGAALCFAKAFAAIPLLATSLTLQCGAIFGFFFRALPLLQQHLEESSTTVATSWQFSYSSFVALGGVVFTFFALILASVLAKGARYQYFLDQRAKNREPTAVSSG